MNTLLTYSGFIGSYLILCGVIKFYFYYKHFGISILRFIDLTEILTLFMDNLIAYFFVILPTSTFLYCLHKNAIKKIPLNEITPFSVISLEWKFITIALIGLLFSITVYFKKNKGVSRREYFLLTLLVITCVTLVPVCFYTILMISNILYLNLSFSQILLALLATILLIFSILTAKNEALKVIKNNYFKGVEIEFKDGTKIISSQNNFYIGMTKNYCFIYDTLLQKCSVRKMEMITSLIFSKRNNRLT